MSIQKVTSGVIWPGSSSNSSPGKWDALKRALDTLSVGGAAMLFSFEDATEVPHAQATISGYAQSQNAKKNGWRYVTTSRGADLYVRKVSIAG